LPRTKPSVEELQFYPLFPISQKLQVAKDQALHNWEYIPELREFVASKTIPLEYYILKDGDKLPLTGKPTATNFVTLSSYNTPDANRLL
jgi:hypothetical protein